MFKFLYYDTFYKIPDWHIYVGSYMIARHDNIHRRCSKTVAILENGVFKSGMEFVPEIAVRILRV